MPDVDELLAAHEPFARAIAARVAFRNGATWLRADLESVALEATWAMLRWRNDLVGDDLAAVITTVVQRRCVDLLRTELGRPGTRRHTANHNRVDLDLELIGDGDVADDYLSSTLEDDVVALVEAQLGLDDAEVVLAHLRGITLDEIATARGVTPCTDQPDPQQRHRPAQDQPPSHRAPAGGMTDLLSSSRRHAERLLGSGRPS